MRSGFAIRWNGLQAYPRCRVPAAPLAGALLICISALSIASSGPPEPDDVWQLSVLGADRLNHPLTPGMRACCRLGSEPQGLDF